MRYILIVFLWAVPLRAAGTVPVWVPLLEPAVKKAIAGSTQVQETLHKSLAASVQSKSGRSQPDPVLVIGFQGIPVGDSLTAEGMTQVPTIGLRQSFHSWGTGAASEEALQHTARSLQYTAWMQANREAGQLIGLLFDRQRLQHDLDRTATTIGWYELLADAIDARYRSGQGIRQAGEQVRVEIGRLRVALSRIALEQNTVHARWFSVAGEEMPALPAIPADQPRWQPDGIEIETTPLVEIADAAYDAEKSEHKLARRSWLPHMFVEAGYGIRGGGRKDLLQAKLGLSVPFWGGGTHRGAVDAAAEAMAAGRIRKLGAVRQTEAYIQELRSMLFETAKQADLYRNDIIPGAEAARDSAAGAYKSGEVDIESVVQAANMLLQVQLEESATQLAQRKLEAAYLAELGLLIATSDLGVER